MGVAKCKCATNGVYYRTYVIMKKIFKFFGGWGGGGGIFNLVSPMGTFTHTFTKRSTSEAHCLVENPPKIKNTVNAAIVSALAQLSTGQIVIFGNFNQISQLCKLTKLITMLVSTAEVKTA